MYEYVATIVDVHDGDSVTADIDLGLRCWLRGQKLRLRGINAPELRGETLGAAQKSREFLRQLVVNKTLRIQTHKDSREKFGRWLATIYLPEGDSVNQVLLDSGHAVPYEA